MRLKVLSLFDRIKSVFTGEKTTEVEQTKVEQEEINTYEEGLEKPRKTFTRRFKEMMASFRYEDEEFFEELEDLLIESDVGFEATMEISDIMRYEAKVENIRTVEDAERVLVRTMIDMYERTNPDYVEFKTNPNGSLSPVVPTIIEENNSVMLAAGDTFRAGAIEQLKVWGSRVGAEVISTKQGGDPSAVVFDAIKQAQENNYDYLLVDTAGRLQNKKNLMDELEKMNRVIEREIPGAPHETILVLDATTGQNALNQAKQFQEITNLTGIALTKMDGTAKGGIVLAIGKELKIPVKFVGLGEKMEDLHPFDSEKFAYGMFKDLVN